jgi:hypothetical protein
MQYRALYTGGPGLKTEPRPVVLSEIIHTYA